MSAPDTNIDRQTRRHWPSILGICAALALGIVIGLLIASILNVNGPQVTTSFAPDILPILLTAA